MEIARLSGVLKSERAVFVNIEIRRACIQLWKKTVNYTELLHKIEAVEKKYDRKFVVVFDAIKQLMTPPEKGKRKMGF